MFSFLLSLIIVTIFPLLILKGLAAVEENKEEISFGKPGKEYIIFSLLAAVALTLTDLEPYWLVALTIVYMVINAETDYKECVVYRMLHYPVIICSAIVYYQNFGFKVAIPFVYLVLLILAHILKAYKSGDTWMFFSLGMFLMANGFDDMSLLLFWLYSIVVFLLLNITKLRIAPLDGQEKKTLRLTEPQPIGPAILIGFLIMLL